MAALSDGVVVGSALVNKIAELDVTSGVSDQDVAECSSVIRDIRNSINDFN